MRIFTIALLLFIGQLSLAAAPARPTCGSSISGTVMYDFCIYPGENPANKDVMIYFHPIWGNAQSWATNKHYQKVRAEWKRIGWEQPTVITISLGEIWLLSMPPSTRNTLSAIFYDVLPKLEKRVGFDESQGRRYMLGESMGGYNSLQLALRHPEKFYRVAINCPIISTLKPSSSKADQDAYIRRTGASRWYVEFLMTLGRDYYPTDEIWDLHNPLTLVSTQTLQLPEMYLSAGDKDEFGIFEGTNLFHQIVQQKSPFYEWRPLSNAKHCDMDEVAVARFIARPE